MSVRAKTYIDDLISINSIVTVYYLKMTGGTTSGDKHNFWDFQYIDKGNYQIAVTSAVVVCVCVKSLQSCLTL